MALPPEQLTALASLDHPKSIAALAAENGMPYPSAHKAVKTLEATGIVSLTPQGRTKLVAAASSSIAALASQLVRGPQRQDWHRAFYGDRLVLLHVLDRVRRPELAAQVCGVTRSTMYHAIKIHAEQGILLQEGEGYRINPRLAEFKAFLLEWNTLHSLKLLRDIDPTAVPVWKLGFEILFRIRAQLSHPGVQAGAYTAFAAYGAPIVERKEPTYYATSRILGPADAVLQAMVADSEAATPTSRAHWAAFIEKTQPTDLEEKAAIYGQLAKVRQVQRYLRDHQANGFLPWNEYARFREQYGVA